MNLTLNTSTTKRKIRSKGNWMGFCLLANESCITIYPNLAQDLTNHGDIRRKRDGFKLGYFFRYYKLGYLVGKKEDKNNAIYCIISYVLLFISLYLFCNQTTLVFILFFTCFLSLFIYFHLSYFLPNYQKLGINLFYKRIINNWILCVWFNLN